MFKEKRPHGLGLVGRQVVGDDVNLAPLRLRGDDVAEQFDERGAGVSGHRLREDFARLRVERGEQRECAVPVVLEAVPFGSTGRQRQHGIEAIERLRCPRGVPGRPSSSSRPGAVDAAPSVGVDGSRATRAQQSHDRRR